MAAGVRRSYRLVVDGQPFTARVDDGTLHASAGADGEVDVEISLGEDALKAIASGQLAAADAVARGDARVEKGDPAEAIAFADMVAGPRALARRAA